MFRWFLIPLLKSIWDTAMMVVNQNKAEAEWITENGPIPNGYCLKCVRRKKRFCCELVRVFP